MRKLIFALFVLCCFGGTCLPQEGSGIGVGKTERTEKNARLKILSMPRAKYTEAARKYRISGTVKLRIEFNESGKIGKVIVVESLPYGLTEQAMIAARQITFLPERKDGKNVSVTKIVPFDFNIN